MGVDHKYLLIPKDRNFKPSASQLNHLFDRMTEYPEIFTLKCRHQKGLNIPPLTPEELAAEYEETFGKNDFEYFLELEHYYRKDFEPDWGSPYPYQGIHAFHENLFQQFKQNPQMAFVSEREEDFAAKHVLLEGEHMRPVREALLQHQHQVSYHAEKSGIKENYMDIILFAHWLDFPELDQVDLSDPQNLQQISSKIDFFKNQYLLDLDYLTHTHDVIYRATSFCLDFPSRQNLIQILVEKSLQLSFDNLNLQNNAFIIRPAAMMYLV